MGMTGKGALMARRGSEKRQLSGQVLVRLTSDQNAAVVARAQAARVSTAAWLRKLIAKAVDVEPGPVTRTVVAPEIVLEVAQLRCAAADMSDALFEIGITLREEGRDADYAAIWALLNDVTSVVLDIDRLKEKLWRAVG